MYESVISRSYLESLTTEELLSLSDNRGIEIPAELERNFIIEEILDAFLADAYSPEEGESLPLEETDILDPVPLPKHYNITYIDVIVRDPLWVYAFWEIKCAEKEIYEKESNFEGYFLKVCPNQGTPGDPFTVAVGIEDTSWYLGFSTGLENLAFQGQDKRSFRLELCASLGVETEVLAVSRLFTLPALMAPLGSQKDRPELRLLSGLDDDLPVLRNGDRLSRILYVK
jgi:hypothetical protein